MRRVLVTQRLVANTSYPEERDALDVRWGGFLHAAGLVPVVVPSGYPIDDFLEGLDYAGLLLTGGNDLAAVSDDPFSRRRDALEDALLERATRRGVPVLGVCRGMQFLAHRHGHPMRGSAGHAGTRHRLVVDPGTTWFADFQDAEVNSYHGVCPGESPSGLRVAARAPDGTVEAVEHPSRPLIGIQWHPEREAEPRPADLALFRRFLGGGRAT